MKTLRAYLIEGHELRIRPAPVERPWMEASDRRSAYRCLPLNIANAHGWEVLCTSRFSAMWNGTKDIDAISVRTSVGKQPPAISHFGNGVLTFHVPCLFQTDPDVDLYVTGPVNRPKDGIAALSGIVETDWSPYSFTMNWLFTRPFHKVWFEEDEPFCHLFPISRGKLEEVAPEMRNLAENPELERDYKSWSASRNSFNADLAVHGSAAAQQEWQKSYFRGVTPSGSPGPAGHRSRLRLKPFKSKG